MLVDQKFDNCDLWPIKKNLPAILVTSIVQIKSIEVHDNKEQRLPHNNKKLLWQH